MLIKSSSCLVAILFIVSCCFCSIVYSQQDQNTPAATTTAAAATAPTDKPTIIPLGGIRDVDIKITLRKGDVAPVDFGLLLKKSYPGMTVRITTPPQRGKLWAIPAAKDGVARATLLPNLNGRYGQNPKRRKAQLKLSFSDSLQTSQGTSPKNLFLYEALPNAQNNDIFDAYEETFQYTVEDGNQAGQAPFDGTAYVSVYNTKPMVPAQPIIKYARTSFGDTAGDGYGDNGDGDIKKLSDERIKKNSQTQVPFYDADVFLCGSNELKSITVVAGSTIGNACKIKTVNGDRELADGVVLSNTESFVYPVFDNERGDPSSKQCQFSYLIKDSSDAVSNQGTLKFQQRNSDDENKSKPRVFDKIYRYYPTRQQYLVISLSSYGDTTSAVSRKKTGETGNAVGLRTNTLQGTSPVSLRDKIENLKNPTEELGKRTFYITDLPKTGKLYRATSLASLTNDPKYLEKNAISRPIGTGGSGSNNQNTVSDPIPVYTTTSRRVHLLYKLPSDISFEQIDKLFSANDTFKWQVKSADGVMSRSALVTIIFKTNNKDTSAGGANNNTRTQLKCGIKVYDWVFWNRMVSKVLLNFTLPRGDRLEKLTLVGLEGSPFQWGKMYKRSSKIENGTFTTTAINLGDNVILGDTRWPKIRFLPNASLSKQLVDTKFRTQPITQTYSFKVETKRGSQCLAKIVFMLRKHEQTITDVVVDPNTGKQTSVDHVAVFDTAPYGRWSLFALQGRYSTNPDYQSVRLSVGPQRGLLYTVSDKLPYEEGMTGKQNANTTVVDPNIDSYCVRHDCSKYIKRRLVRGDFFQRKPIFSRSSTEEVVSQERFWVLYRAPFKRSRDKSGEKNLLFSEEDLAKGPQGTDTFTIQYCKSNDPADCAASSETQYKLNLFEGNLRRIYVTFVNNQNSANFNSVNSSLITTNAGDMTVVPITFTDYPQKSTLIRILDFNQATRHGIDPEFRLFQARRNGDKFDFGEPLTDSTNDKYGLTGKFISTQNSDENTILLVPKAGTRYQNFRFRARLYNKTVLDQIVGAGGNSQQLLDPSAKENRAKMVLTSYEDVRVIAVRQNTPPVWNVTEDEKDFGDVPLGKSVSWSFQAIDKDNDQLTFIVSKAPIHGDLFLYYTVFGKGRSVHASDGTRFTAPLGSTDFRSWIVLEYRPRFESGLMRTYPNVSDSFTLIADDGSGVLSAPMTVKAKIVPPLEGWSGAFATNKPGVAVGVGAKLETQSTSYVIHVVVFFVICVAGGGVLWFLRRRNLLRQQFTKLANFNITETEMT